MGDRVGARPPLVGRVQALGGDARARAAGRPHRSAAGGVVRGTRADADARTRHGAARREAQRREGVWVADVARPRASGRACDQGARGPSVGGARPRVRPDACERLRCVQGCARRPARTRARAVPRRVDDAPQRARAARATSRRPALRRAAHRARRRLARGAQPGRVLQPRAVRAVARRCGRTGGTVRGLGADADAGGGVPRLERGGRPARADARRVLPRRRRRPARPPRAGLRRGARAEAEPD